MNIQQATKKAMRTHKCIRRKSEPLDYKFMPTDTSSCIVLIKDNKMAAARWQPRAEDLTANDWQVV